MALDKDGTQWFSISGAGAVVAVPSTNIGNMTGATTGAGGYQIGSGGTDINAKLAVVFPEPRDVAGLFISGAAAAGTGTSSGSWQYSLDTTNGLDGTWTTAVAAYSIPYFAVPGYRTNILPVTLSAVRGVRWARNAIGSYTAIVGAFHVYGAVTAAAGDRLAIWHPTLDQVAPGTLFDWGDVPRNTTSTRTFRVKNLSTSKTAGAVRAAMSSLPTEASPTVIGQHLLSADGSTWLSQLTLGDMAPGAISGVLSLRRTTPSNAQPGLYIMRVFAESTTTWT
jgi:hypothetical protein